MLFKDIMLLDENYEVKNHMNIVTENNKITYIGKDIPLDYRGEIFDGTNKLAMPGFFNSHCHIPMTIVRGYGDGLPLQRWLFEKIFPFEAQLTGEDCYWATLLGAMELIKSGVVSFSDMYFYIDDIARATRESGLKANICHGTSGMEEATRFEDLKAFTDTEALYNSLKGQADDRIKVDVGLHAEYTSKRSLVEEVAAYAKSKDLIVQAHVSETKKEHEECKRRFGMTPTAYFEKCGLLDQPLVAAHCVWIEGEDFDILRDKGASVAHCISSNLKLASGFAPIKKMLEKGVNVSIGTDGASSNNNLNMIEEVNLVAMVHKGVTQDPQFLRPQELFKLATYKGAMAQGRKDCGKIKVGNRADIVVYDLDKPHLQPVHDVLSNMLFSAQASDICFSMIDGNVVYKDGQLTQIDGERVIYEVNKISKRILGQL